MAFVDLPGLRCHLRLLEPQDGLPPAATAVLVHGLLTDSMASYYFSLGPALAGAGLRVLMYDQRGHGRSSRPARGYRLEQFLDDLEALLDRLGIGGPVHLVGNCFGGTAAFQLAVRRPEQVRSILAIESEPATPAWAAKMARLLQQAEVGLPHPAVCAWIAGRFGPHTARLARQGGRLLTETSLAEDLPASRLPSEAQLRAVRCPVLAVYGTESDLAGQASWLAGLLPACRTAMVPGQEHAVLAEAPAETRELALSWLARQGAVLRRPAAAGRPAAAVRQSAAGRQA